MPAKVDTEKCNACKSCEEACPNGSIKVDGEFAVVNVDDCIDCSACVDVCESHAVELEG